MSVENASTFFKNPQDPAVSWVPLFLFPQIVPVFSLFSQEYGFYETKIDLSVFRLIETVLPADPAAVADPEFLQQFSISSVQDQLIFRVCDSFRSVPGTL